MGAVRYEKTAKDEMDSSAWDGAAAVQRLQKWASSDGSGNKDTINWAKYRRGFTWYDADDDENFGAYKLPHHDVVDGTLTCKWRGVTAAMGALMGARGGVDMPEADRKSVHRHLASHYDEWDMDPPSMTSQMSRLSGRGIVLSDFSLALEEVTADGKSRSIVQLMKGGDFVHPAHPEGLSFNRKLFDELVGNFESNIINREILVDADHDSAGWGSTIAYGWLEAIEARGSGKKNASLWVTVRWTPRGAQAVTDEDYKYTSVEMAFDYEDEYGVTHGPAVVAMALTNRPFLRGMQAVTLNAQDYPDYWNPAVAEAVLKPKPQERPMNLFDRLLVNLRELWTPKDGNVPTDDEIVARLADHFERVQPLEAQGTQFREHLAEALKALVMETNQDQLATTVAAAAVIATPTIPVEPTDLDQEGNFGMSEEEVTTTTLREILDAQNEQITRLEESNTKLTEQVSKLTDERDVFAAQQRLDAARMAGKITPAMEEQWARDLARMDPAAFDRIVASLPENKALRPEIGVDAMNDDESVLQDPVAEFDARVRALDTEEKIGYSTAYLRVKSEAPMLYDAYVNARGLGVSRRR